MGVASGCGEQEAGVASGRGWNLWLNVYARSLQKKMVKTLPLYIRIYNICMLSDI